MKNCEMTLAIARIGGRPVTGKYIEPKRRCALPSCRRGIDDRPPMARTCGSVCRNRLYDLNKRNRDAA